MRKKRKTAGELANIALSDNTKYDGWDVALEFSKELGSLLIEAVVNHKYQIENSDQDEFCVTYLLCADPIIPNMIRRKIYVWPFLPSPRPDQGVFLYNKKLCQFTKRLWILPNPKIMAQLGQPYLCVPKKYETMQAWSIAFYSGTFWEYIRYEHDIKMLSQQEYFDLHRNELLKSGFDLTNPRLTDSFDFSKISANNVGNPNELISA